MMFTEGTKNMTKAGIKIENVHLSFGQTEVLKGVNLDIKPGEFFAFLGPSGSGKSTLLRAIAGFGPKPKGRILIGGRMCRVGGALTARQNFCCKSRYMSHSRDGALLISHSQARQREPQIFAAARPITE